jgi:hypothetical protein
MAGFRIEGNTSGNVVEVAGTNQLKIIPETDVATNPANVGAVRSFSENDPGFITGTPYLMSTEVDDDFRARASLDTFLDEENYNYVAQNTGKHFSVATTLVPAWTAGNYNTNSTNLTTTTTGTTMGTYAYFPLFGTATTSFDIEAAFSAQPVANTIIDFGGFLRGAANPYAPTDGCYFRLTSAGLQGIMNYNGTELSTGVFPTSSTDATPWPYVNSKKYQFIMYITSREVEFWINDNGNINLMGALDVPVGNGQPMMASSVPFSVRHAIVGGAAGGAISLQVSRYSVRLGGPALASTVGTMGNRLLGSYQGLSGGTMGSLATYPNSTNPTAAAPSNTALTANLPGGLGGQGTVTAAVAAATDGIWSSYQVPAGTVNIQGRRLVLRGVRLDAVNLGAAVATTATTIQFSLAFGHTAVSLATAEATGAKAPRRVAMGIMTWPVAAAIGQGPQGGSIYLDLGDAPLFVNPGEFIALVGKFLVGTATASQTIGFIYQPIYGWE